MPENLNRLRVELEMLQEILYCADHEEIWCGPGFLTHWAKTLEIEIRDIELELSAH